MSARTLLLIALSYVICLSCSVTAFAGSVDLLKYLPYDAVERNQASCGNCWVWAGTGIMEMARSVRNETVGTTVDLNRDRLSIQFLNSCDTDPLLVPCQGGNVDDFMNFYQQQKFVIPWSNTNAHFQDQQGEAISPVACNSIGKTPHYPLDSIAPKRIVTTGVAQSVAIANIKKVLDQRKAVQMDYYLPDANDWGAFYNFWGSQDEGSIWNPDFSCGHAWGADGSGHAVIIVGYNDDDPDPAKHYWLVVNSWGVANGVRMNGVYRQAMYVNYDCSFRFGGTALDFYEFDHSFGSGGACSYGISPASKSFGSAGGSGSVNVTSQAGCSWSVTGAPGWVTVTSGGSGAGDGVVNYTVSANSGSEAREATVTVAGKRLIIFQEGAGATPLPSNVLRNGGFESGPVEWTGYSSGGHDIVTKCDADAHSGSWCGSLGGYDAAVESIYQDLQIPANLNAYLEFYYGIETEESARGPYDLMSVAILRPGGDTALKDLVTLSNLDATNGWAKSARIDISEFAGKTIRLLFRATADYGFATSFLLDDVTLLLASPSAPNLARYQPEGWSDSIVISHQADSITDSTPLRSTEPLYVKWAVQNNGSKATPGGFSVALYVDSVLKNSWDCPLLGANAYCYNDTAYSIGSLSAGTHSVRVVADPASAVGESNESDNSYTRSLSVAAPQYAIGGTVRTAGSGGAIAGATVSVAGKVAATDAGGAFSITGIPGGTYTLAISANGYATYTDPAFSVTSDLNALTFTLTPDLPQPNVVISGSTQGYSLLQQAYDAAASGAALLVRGITLTENFSASAAKTVSIRGGYDSAFATRSGRTTMGGTLRIRQGKIVADRVAVGGAIDN